MSQNNKTQVTKRATTPAAIEQDEAPPESLDSIKRKYQSVLREPIPPRLAALIQRLRMVEQSREL